MTIEVATSKEAWNHFLHSQPESVFLQSWEWGSFQESLGKKIVRLQLVADSKIVGVSLWIFSSIPFFGTLAYCPRGPLLASKAKGSEFAEMFVALIEGAKGFFPSDTFCCRVEPQLSLEHAQDWKTATDRLQFKPITPVQPSDTQTLDLKKSEAELLTAMHPKTRYNIKLAERKGVVISKQNSHIADFLMLNKETTARDGFISHSDSHYLKMVELLPSHMIDVYAATYEKKVIAANLVIHFGNTTTYLHGASGNSHREVMAPHLLQWRQILDAKAASSLVYDFWGIKPTQRHSSKASRWGGITRFKQGFGGTEKNYLGTFDLKLKSLWYSLYRVANLIRR